MLQDNNLMSQRREQSYSRWRKLAFISIWALSDVLLSTVLILRGRFDRLYPEVFISVNGYNCSLLDIWVLGPIRSMLIIGSLLGIVYNPADGTDRVKLLSRIVSLAAVLMWSYPQIKMLIYIENTVDLSPEWFWPFFVWSEICALMFAVNWRLLGTCAAGKLVRNTLESINSTDGERQCLLDSKIEENKEKKPETSARTPAANILRLLVFMMSKSDLVYIVVASIFMVASSVAEIFAPLFTSLVLQAIAYERSWDKFTSALWMIVVIKCLVTLFIGLRGGFFKIVLARLNIRIRKKLFASVMSQELSFFDTKKTGEITSRLTADVTTMLDALSLNANMFLRIITVAVGMCLFMFKLSWRLSMIMVIGLPLVVVVSELYGEFLKSLTHKIQDALAKLNEVAEEACSSVKTVRSFAGEDLEVTRYSGMLERLYSLNKREAVASSGYMWYCELVSVSFLIATLYYGGHLIMHDLLAGGDMVSFLLYQIQLTVSYEYLSIIYTGLMQAVGASEKVFEIIDRKPQIRNDGHLAPASLEGKVEFHNVSFKYPSQNDTLALKSVSLTIEPGEVVALVGPSGGGKSTSVGLIKHFYEPTEGTVLLDGMPVQEYSHSYLHSKIALVSQEPVLFARSLEDNIAYGLPTWSKDDVIKAAQMANAHQFISEMKNKYETEAGEKGTQLSGGQKQRVAIARAIIRNPAVLILDEATSALDAESEFTVQKAIEKNLTNRTVIIIAHRLSTVERADRIIVIDHGAIAEQGTHTQLLHSGGLYSQLVKRQLLGQNIDAPEPPPPPPPMVIHNRTMSSGDTDTVPLAHNEQQQAVEPLISVHKEQERPSSPLISMHREESWSPQVSTYSEHEQSSSPLILVHNEQDQSVCYGLSCPPSVTDTTNATGNSETHSRSLPVSSHMSPSLFDNHILGSRHSQ